LRVGLAAVKALAEVLERPIATVSVLHAVAVAGGINGTVAAVLDAGRKEAFVGEYDMSTAEDPCIREYLVSQEELFSAVPEPIVTSDKSIVEAARSRGIEAGHQVKEIDRPGADVMARLGWKKIKAGETVTPEALDANYIRRSDAEIFSSGKR
jgi:tRNA threonylcarbamoyladenosine biosynthesis protein TsaB